MFCVGAWEGLESGEWGVWQSVEDTVACWHNSKTALLRPPPKHLPHGAASQTVTKKTGGGRVCVRVRNCVWACVVMMAKEGSMREEEKRRRREGSCKQIMTPSNDYLRLPLWPPMPITEIRQPEPVSVCAHTSVSISLSMEQNACVILARTHACVFNACYQGPDTSFSPLSRPCVHWGVR